MTEAQTGWLAENPKFSPVRYTGPVVLEHWTDEGYLWPDGRFSPDDGQTLFWKPYEKGAVRVGRRYAVC